jgi:Skp family chaperone for outer membrane proteins
MTNIFKALCGTALALTLVAPLAAQTRPTPAAAPAASTGAIVPGIGVANLDAAIVNTKAYKAAAQQRLTYYKPQYDAAQAKANQIDAQLKVAVDKFNADKAAKKPDAVLQQDYAAVQNIQEGGKEEIRQILMPVILSEAYVNEQIAERLDQAVQSAMAKRGITILLGPDTVIARANAYELTPAIITELDVLLPTVNFVPPQGWLPRSVREQQAQQQAQQPRPAAAAQPRPATATPAATPAPRPAGPQPDGR